MFKVLTGGEVRVLTAALRCFRFKGRCCSVCVTFALGGAAEPGRPELNGQNISAIFKIKSE